MINIINTVLSLLVFILIREQVFLSGYYIIIFSVVVIFFINFKKVIDSMKIFERGD